MTKPGAIVRDGWGRRYEFLRQENQFFYLKPLFGNGQEFKEHYCRRDKYVIVSEPAREEAEHAAS